MPELLAPTADVQQSFLAAMAEFQAEHRGSPDDDSMLGQEIRGHRDRWHEPSAFAAYVQSLRADALEETPRRAGWVPCTTLWWIDGNQYLGRIAIRHRLTPSLLEHGGHIGYDVRPSARMRGHATRMLRASLSVAYRLGIERALLTCDKGNLASRKVIEANGGILEDERDGTLRFWVPATPRERDWLLWHKAYEHPDSSLTHRLAAVREQVRLALDAAPPGPIKVLSLCAGQGRDLTGPVSAHPRRADVQARLVELDPRNASVAASAAPPGFEVLVGDAGLTELYADLVPVRLVLLCGMFGNMDEENVRRTVAASAAMCEPGGTVIWTRGRRAPDQVPRICAWYEQAGFEVVWVSEPDRSYGVGVCRFTGTRSVPLPTGRLFAFSG